MTLRHEISAIPNVWEEIARLRDRSLDHLAPRVKDAAVLAIADCHGQSVTVMLPNGETETIPLDAVVHETLRSNALQSIYYEQGTTNAATAEKSWHFYGLALDVISAAYEWFGGKAAKDRWPDSHERQLVSDAWFGAVGATFERHGFAWGGRWRHPDLPHVQWGKCAVSPHNAPHIYASQGREAVWRAVGAA